MITASTDPLHEYEQALSSSLPHLTEEQRDLTVRTAISLAYKSWTKVSAHAAPPAIIPHKPAPVTARSPSVKQGMVKNRVVVPKQFGKWTDAQFMALTRDTRSFIQHRVSTGEDVGDWYDMRQHLEILHAVARCVNWPDPRDLAPKRPPMCLEIGVRHGVSTLALLTAMRETGGKLISVEIDPEWAQDATDRVLEAGLGEWWELHIMSSDTLHERLDTQLDLLWIDGSHEEEFVRADFGHFAPRVRQGGFILMHDYWTAIDPTDPEQPANDSGVMLVVEEARRTSKYETLTLPWSHGLTIMRVL